MIEEKIFWKTKTKQGLYYLSKDQLYREFNQGTVFCICEHGNTIIASLLKYACN